MTLDPRLNAYRADLADLRLKGKVEAARFVAGEPRRVVADTAPIKSKPGDDAPLASEALRGEIFTTFGDARDGWIWGQLETDSYVGYVPAAALCAVAPEPTHRIGALRAFVYPGPDMKRPAAGVLSFASRVALAGEAVTRGTAYRLIEGSERAIIASQAVPVDVPAENDFVAVAERFLNVAYLWGGRTSLGLDCSALVQLALAAAGRKAPRDTDLQEAMVGTAVAGGPSAPLRRGDLVFWRGHVAIMIDGEYMLHASGHHTAVVIEPLAEAMERIARSGGGAPTSVRRL